MSTTKLHLKTTLLTLFSLVTLSIASSLSVHAANMSEFNPGNIMSDYTMANKNSLSEAQIQNFLSSKNPCNDRNIAKAAQYPNMTYHIENGKFVCLAEESFGGESAAHIIWQASQDYTINPQVLIVLLEKEQGLITDTWPNSNVQYRSATGYGCPDTAACDTQYYGFKNQIRNAANFFRAHLDNNPCWSKPHIPGVQRAYWRPVNSCNGSEAANGGVKFHPNNACGATPVNIQNRATSGLYSYTPYQPNSAALNAGYGTGDGCSSYGNRNFWGLFSDWFGSTQGSGFVGLEDPRWMKVSKATSKVHAYSGERFGPTIPADSQAKFIDKVFVNNRWIARTHWDYVNGNLDGFPADELGEINFENIPPTTLVLNKNTRKYDPLRDRQLEQSSEASMFKAVDKVTIDSKTYYRTEWERSNGRTGGFSTTDVDNFRMFDFVQPRYMITKRSVSKIDILTGSSAGSLPANNIYFFNKLVRLNNITYAQLKSDNGTNYAVSSNDLGEIDSANPFYPFVEPRMMRLSADTSKFDIFSGAKTGPLLANGTDAFFVDQVKINGSWYARTQWDRDNNNSHGILVDELSEIRVTDIPDIHLKTKRSTRKIDPVHQKTYEVIDRGAEATYVDKVTILGREYYRTQWEATQDRLRFIPADDLIIEH